MFDIKDALFISYKLLPKNVTKYKVRILQNIT